MTSWEYKVTQVLRRTVEKELNELGAEGWEVALMRDGAVGSVALKEGKPYIEPWYSVVLKRPIDGRRRAKRAHDAT